MVATVKASMLQLVIPAELRKGDSAKATARRLKAGERIGLAPWTDMAGKAWLIHADGESGLRTESWERLAAEGHVDLAP